VELDPTIRIVLAAPTGKAAARMQEALRQRVAQIPENLRAKLPWEAQTIHRLLGLRAYSTHARYDKHAPLPLDVLIVDEASMLDLALATRLVEAVPKHARLVLLGDKDQLASVEAGGVFNTLASGAGLLPRDRDRLERCCKLRFAATTDTARQGIAAGPLAGTAVWLQRSYRFTAGEGIGRLANAVRDFGKWGQSDQDDLPLSGAGVNFVEVTAPALPETVIQQIVDGYTDYFDALAAGRDDPGYLLGLFDQHRVLGALRMGPRGIETLNAEISRRIARRLHLRLSPGSVWYPGRAIMVRGNDYALRVFNGDVGIALPAAGGYHVWFADSHGGVRAVAASRLPPHETAYCITVHKAQGSEYARISFVLPEATHVLLTRELVYTAITRATTSVSIYGSRSVLKQAAARSVRRLSGLDDRLREAAIACGE
jgi:exodeoxyribonuclease V alpha subunit